MTPRRNPTLSRFDRAARALGIEVDAPKPNCRTFANPAANRSWRVRPGGRGVLRIEAYVNGQLDASDVVGIERAEQVLQRVALETERAEINRRLATDPTARVTRAYHRRDSIDKRLEGLA